MMCCLSAYADQARAWKLRLAAIWMRAMARLQKCWPKAPMSAAKDCDIGGGFTPAPAMGDKLIARLVDNAGLYFRMEK